MFYQLEGTSPFLLIDLSIVGPAPPDPCLEPEALGRKRIFFDKTGATTVPPLDRVELVRPTKGRLARLRERIEMRHVFVDKYLNHGQPIEALDSYHGFVLQPPVEALRITYSPVHHEWGTKYVYRELPPDVVHRLETLSFVKNGEDLRTKVVEAREWFRELAATS